MKQKIYKYAISPVNGCLLPPLAEILDIQLQHGNMYIWALVDPDDTPECGRIKVYGTGWEIPPNQRLRHLKTIQVEDLVWHIFDTRPL